MFRNENVFGSKKKIKKESFHLITLNSDYFRWWKNFYIESKILPLGFIKIMITKVLNKKFKTKRLSRLLSCFNLDIFKIKLSVFTCCYINIVYIRVQIILYFVYIIIILVSQSIVFFIFHTI